MNTASNAKLHSVTEQRTSLTNVLRQIEHVKELVKESADELSSLSTVLGQEIANHAPSRGIADAIEKSEAVEQKVEDLSKKLTLVNQALEVELRDQFVRNQQLAAVTEQEEAARHASLHDVLTGLPNRALFNDRLQHGIAQARRHHWALAVMFLDLDEFKTINDSHGHGAGDSVLMTVAHRLKESTRSDDTVGRFGGDEFVFLLMGIRDEMSVALFAKKIIDAIQAPMTIRVGDLNVDVSIRASIGISISPKNGTAADTLVANADSAMYQAKRSKSGYSLAR
ncbi:MAG: GGDEF domain-containing protein [Casimicrobiaceae bacterium]